MSSPCVTLSASLILPDNLSFRSHFDVKFKTVDFELGLIKFS